MLFVGLSVCLTGAATSEGIGAQSPSPFTAVITPNANPLRVAECSPVRLALSDTATKAAPRNPRGILLSLADFDMTVVSARDGVVVGRYEGASQWSACACPGSEGATVTITATYPARSLAPAARVAGAAFQTSISVPVIAGRSSATPIGCEVIKTTTAGASRETAPWTVTLLPSLRAFPVGSCTPVNIDLRDATGKEPPRNPRGLVVSLADFDMSVTPAQSGAVIGRADGPAAWSVCGCQGASIGTTATITASYPARALAEAARVAGVAFQSSTTISLTAPNGTFNPVGCGATQSTPITPAPASSSSGAAVGTPIGVAGTGAPRSAPVPVYQPGPVTVNVGLLTGRGSWYEPGPVTVNLGSLSGHGSWYEPGPVAITFNLSGSGSWLERAAPAGPLQPAPVRPR